MKHTRLLMIAGLLLTACGVAADSGQLLERLRLDHAAMVAAEQDFHERRHRSVPRSPRLPRDVIGPHRRRSQRLPHP